MASPSEFTGSPRLARLAFIEDDPTKLWEQCEKGRAFWETARHRPEFSEAMAEYRKQKAVNLVWHSNELEGTLPSGISQQQAVTCRLLENLYSGESKDELEQNGVGDQLGKRQICQHMLAYLQLCESAAIAEESLTEHLIQSTHGLLMDGLTTEDGLPIDAGKYRQGSVCAGNHVFPPSHLVPSAMAKIVEGYNHKLSETHDPYALASWLLYQVVTIHPFQDGNGRLCRMLACYSLMRDGLPFPVTITSGHKKSQKHFVWALTRDRTDTRGGQPHLTTLIVSSVLRSWNNFSMLTNSTIPLSGSLNFPC